MSAILLGTNIKERLQTEENEIINKSKEFKEKFIEGKNKTYVMSRTLGKGTFGKVKLAYNKDNKNEKYACKILLKSNIKDEDDSIRCKREMDILKKMHHVNVVRTYEIVSTDTTFYIFMDYCAKGELFNYIVKKRHLSEEKSAFFYYQLVNGIEYIHKKGVCHRDLKPENLLLTEKMKIKIIDFGLSNYFTGNLLETPCGSPCYASPEMVIGNKYNGFCIDIWSSGIILYAMLCGYLPFEESENDEYNEILFRNIVECNIEYPTEFVTPIAKDLLKKILVKDPKKRITIEEIKQHNFYLMGEILYKQTFESFGPLKEYELFYFKDNLIKNDKDEEENKYINSIKIYKLTDNKENHKKDEILLSNKKEENKNITDNNKKEENKREVFNIEKKSIKNKGKDNEQNTGSKKEKEKENNIKNKTNGIVTNQDKRKNEEKISPKKDNVNDNDKGSYKKEIKQLSLLNNNDDKLLAIDNQKTFYNSIDQLFNLKLDKNAKEVRTSKEPSTHETFNPYLNYKQFNNINFNTNYFNTEIYPKDARKNNKINYYNFKLLNKKSLLDDKITINSIIKTLQNHEYFKSKTPIGHSIINKAIAKKNALSNSNKKEKQKYNSHSPGFSRFAKINNIHFKIKNNLKFPRKNNFSVTNHNNSKNNYFLLNENIFKSFDPQKFFLKNNNKNIKPNKKFLAKANDNNATKNNSKSIKNSININSTNTFNKKKGKTISSAKTNLEGEKFKNAKNKLNLRNFECCLSSNCSKRKHPIIESNKNKFNGNFPSDNYNKNKNARNLSKKSLNKQKAANIQLSNPYINNCDIIKTNNFITNTEFRNNKNISLGKNKINLNKLKLKNKNKKNKFYNLLSKNLNYINNKENQDKDNIIINLNILKPNFILDRQKSSKKPINNKIGLNSNSNSIHLNNNYNLINSKAERTRTESNFNFTMRNNKYNIGNRNKNKNFKSLAANQNKKSVGNNKNIKSIRDMHKVHGNLGNNKRKIFKENQF